MHPERTDELGNWYLAHPVQSSVLRRAYFICVAIILVFLLVVRFFIFPVLPNAPTWRVTLGALFDSLIAAAGTSIALGILIYALSQRSPGSPVRIIGSHELESFICREASLGHRWDVKARTANYFTKVTLPKLIESSRQDGRPFVEVRVVMLDPEHRELLSRYTKFKENGSTSVLKWSERRVKLEIYCSILVCLEQQMKSQLARITIGLSRSFWSTSIDMSERFALLTGQSKGDPGLLIGHDSAYFQIIRHEFEAAFDTSRTCELSTLVAGCSESLLGEFDWCNGVAARLGLGSLTREEFDEVLALQGSPHNYV